MYPYFKKFMDSLWDNSIETIFENVQQKSILI